MRSSERSPTFKALADAEYNHLGSSLLTHQKAVTTVIVVSVTVSSDAAQSEEQLFFIVRSINLDVPFTPLTD